MNIIFENTKLRMLARDLADANVTLLKQRRELVGLLKSAAQDIAVAFGDAHETVVQINNMILTIRSEQHGTPNQNGGRTDQAVALSDHEAS